MSSPWISVSSLSAVSNSSFPIYIFVFEEWKRGVLLVHGCLFFEYLSFFQLLYCWYNLRHLE
jgi:hypothetical protein